MFAHVFARFRVNVKFSLSKHCFAQIKQWRDKSTDNISYKLVVLSFVMVKFVKTSRS